MYCITFKVISVDILIGKSVVVLFVHKSNAGFQWINFHIFMVYTEFSKKKPVLENKNTVLAKT